MKKIFFLIIVCVFSLGFTPAAFADLEGEATAHVWVDVVPNVAVGVLDSQVDIGEVQMGQFSALIGFRIDANMEDVNLYPMVSHLYKGDDPTNTDVAPILVAEREGVLIEPTNANPTAGASNVAASETAFGDPTLGEWAGWQFGIINFESSQNGHFSQDVFVTAYWDQTDPEKPQGEYSGFVTLYCLLTP
ncbi:hypothetical protein [Desulfobacula sp.]|uniref:hypothetical protein n=1 Tax=Desulfobacula sp. TaxID=2593537 RepID=UPI00262A1937|nr:hypothetical protein [Desulfobacula sp.]